MKYVFFGTPEFAEIILEKLIKAGYIPDAVICNPDEPVGRNKISTSPPIKLLIAKLETLTVRVLQPEKLRGNKEFIEELKKLKPDLAIVAAYGKILPKEILEIPLLGFINIHPSILPKYRGASPIQNAILNGDKETGVTIIKLDEEMDHGPVLATSNLQIADSEINYPKLSQKLAEIGANLIIKTIPDYISGKLKPIEQDHLKATYTKIIKKEDGKIDWKKSAQEIERMTQAYYPWPTAWTMWNGKIIKIIEAETLESFPNYKTGETFLNNGELSVKCGNSTLIIKKLQLEGGKVLMAKEFLNGHKNFIGSVLK